MENVKLPVIVVGVDESAHSDRALQWTLQRFFSSDSNTKPQQRWKLVVVHARPYATSIINLAGAGESVRHLLKINYFNRRVLIFLLLQDRLTCCPLWTPV